ncbi:hypothetical protein QBC34DRAFT_384071 [Podospora aff. communis PSN243]|uniref:Uncharacterized protein n=1 Tax=Podospora aff. communis PSN243 TaxID=3040156 RepID=A0AAV9GCT6_9PEZI|nr:hypothetical protein QBC34DRAFT_384071 [Podospora aff. communis PSN243]
MARRSEVTWALLVRVLPIKHDHLEASSQPGSHASDSSLDGSQSAQTAPGRLETVDIIPDPADSSLDGQLQPVVIPDPTKPEGLRRHLLEWRTGLWNGLISGREHLQAIKATHAKLLNTTPKADAKGDSSFPHTDEQRKAYAKLLFHAMADFTNCIVIPGRLALTVKALQEMSDFSYELLAWDLVDMLAEVHLGNLGFPPLMYNLDGQEATGFTYTQYSTFSARLGDACKACKTSKALVYAIMSPDKMLRVAASPRTEVDYYEAPRRADVQRYLEWKSRSKAWSI